MKLSVAISILHEPELLLLDEPTNHCDPQAIEWLATNPNPNPDFNPDTGPNPNQVTGTLGQAHNVIVASKVGASSK